MNKLRMQAARIALFLECAGVVPEVKGSTYREYFDSLHNQYYHLETTLRRRARVEGRQRIRRERLVAVATRLIPIPPPLCNLARLSPKQRCQVQTQYRRKVRRRSPGTPLCPRCRVAAGMPKRSWSTREMAEQAASQQNDPRLHVYPCPAQSGYWHLGHTRK